MDEPSQARRILQRLLHCLALLTVLCTLVLLTLGAEVTTKQVGMVDDQGFRTPWHMFSQPLQERGLGFVIEHGHRLAGFVVGFLMILLTAGAWLIERDSRLRLLATAALVAVSIQGLMGGFRVQLHAWVGPELAMIHGLFAQVVLALLVSFALFTSPWWRTAIPARDEDRRRLRRWGLFLVGANAVQITLGVLMRHTSYTFAPRLHWLTAFVVVIAVVGLTFAVYASRPRLRSLGVLIHGVWAILGLQLFLGMEAWLTRFRSPQNPQVTPLLRPSTAGGADLTESLWYNVVHHPDFLRSIHLPVGALLFSLSVAVCLYLLRAVPPVTVSQPKPLPEIAEVAA